LHTRRGTEATAPLLTYKCFTCSSKKNGYDHHHPDLFKEDEFGNAGAGGISNEGQGSIDATASYLTLMNGAAKMNDKDFDKALSSYENQYFQQKLPQ
jgi:hypothetical protein